MKKNSMRPPGLDGPDQIYRPDRWTRYQWERFVDGDDKAKGIIEKGGEKQYSFPRFGREVFARFFEDEVERVDLVKPEDQWAVKAHQELSELPEFQRLARRCRGDRVVAGAATSSFLENALQDLLGGAGSWEDPEPLREEARGLLQLAKNLIAGGGDPAEVEGLLEETRKKGRAAVHAAVAYADGKDASELRGALRRACEAASRGADEVEVQIGAFAGWGSSVSLDSTAIGMDVKAELARRVGRSDKLQRLAREAGRLRRIAAAKQRSKVDQAREEVVDIELGGDLDRVLPSELVKLADPALSLDFARRHLERGLLQYKLGGKEAQGRGPIVVCIDQSSSMEGGKEIWSKALSLALLEVATMQRRRCRVIHFNGGVVRVDDWAPGKVDALALLESMASFYGGGTAFEPPLRKALEAIAGDRALKSADVVLITDGEAEVSEAFRAEWLEARRRHEFTCYGIHVDAPGGIAPRTLDTVSDVVLGLADLARDRDVIDAVLSI